MKFLLILIIIVLIIVILKEIFMAKITQVTIINPTTLRLDVDAKMGDEIDLLDISKIDNMLVQEIINKEKDKEIKKCFITDYSG